MGHKEHVDLGAQAAGGGGGIHMTVRGSMALSFVFSDWTIIHSRRQQLLPTQRWRSLEVKGFRLTCKHGKPSPEHAFNHWPRHPQHPWHGSWEKGNFAVARPPTLVHFLSCFSRRAARSVPKLRFRAIAPILSQATFPIRSQCSYGF